MSLDDELKKVEKKKPLKPRLWLKVFCQEDNCENSEEYWGEMTMGLGSLFGMGGIPDLSLPDGYSTLQLFSYTDGKRDTMPTRQWVCCASCFETHKQSPEWEKGQKEGL